MAHPRPHAFSVAAHLADSPLDESTVARIRVLRARTTGPVEHSCALETWSPELDTGAVPSRPSLVLAYQPELIPSRSTSRRVRFEHDGHTVRAQVPFATGTRFYGLGELAGPFERTDRTQLLWNTDAWAYGDETPALYQSHPYVLALHSDGSATGVLADTPWRGLVSAAQDGLELAFDGEPFDVHLIDGAHPADVSRALAALLGTIALPPLWALGYHQCRWSYASATEMREIAQRFRQLKIPCDALWFDIDYMDRFRVFTWDENRFPEPRQLVAELRAGGFHSVAILDPGVAVASDYSVCKSGLAGKHFVERSDGEPARGRVWPGICHFPDFTREETRDWWANYVQALVEGSGLSGLWNDMNEPALFRTPGKTLPDDVRHRGLGGGPHAKFHNLYGRLMAEATHAGLTAARPDRRPFVLTRASHLSGARFAATWTGDNQSRWEDLQWAIPMVLNLGLSGQPFAGPDLGGFHGDPEPELFVRWFELGAYLPFCRGHSDKESCRKEPWAFGDEVLAHVRAALERRMRLLPHLYTLFEESARTGLPVCRPLFFADPSDMRLANVDDAFLLGDDLLVAPVVERGARRRRVVLPRTPGGWYAFRPDGTGNTPIESSVIEVDAPLGTTPIFARAGSVIVEGPLIQHVGELAAGAGEERWHVFPAPNGKARGARYVDAGDGRPPTRTADRQRRIQALVNGSGAAVELETEDSASTPAPARQIVVHGR